MAGGKETPRQKLIGLMYLVLLAMLALQVSSAIMEKFFFLDQSLDKAKSDAVVRNSASLDHIKKVAGERNSDASKAQMKKADEVHRISADMLKEIADLRARILKETKGYDESGFYKGAKDPIEELMVGAAGSKKGQGYVLKTKLDKYYQDITALAPEFKSQLKPLALDAKDDPIISKIKEQAKKDFVQLNFEHTPMVACMAVLADKANAVASYEALILNSINPEGATFKFDQLVPMYSAVSSVVAAGTDYEASIFVAGKNQSLKPDITFNGSKLAIEPDGSGKIKFKASGGAYDKDGNMKKSWDAIVKVPSADGNGMTSIPLKGEYMVSKPVIDVKAAAVAALYEGCGNELNIQVPALGALYNPSFSASNASTTKGADKGAIIVVPNSRAKVKISVSSGGTLIGDKEFDVRPVPLPTIEAKSTSGVVSPRTGIKANAPYMDINIKPDAGFAEFLPKEAKYDIAEMKVTVGRGTRARISKTMSGTRIRFSEIQPNPGETILVEIVKLERSNFRGEKKQVPLAGAAAIFLAPIAE